jgi:PAS domain S-box-containing protein
VARSKHLGLQLILGAVLINLFVGLLVGASLYQSHQKYVEDTSISTQNLAQSLSLSIAGNLNKIDAALFALTRETRRQLDGGGISQDSLNQYLADLHHQVPELEQIWVADADGLVRYGTRIPSGNPISIRDREYFARLLKGGSGGLVISQPVIGRVTNAWSILVCKRINRRDGSFAGVAFGSLRFMDVFSGMFSRLDVGKHGVIALCDSDLGLICRYPGSAERDYRVGSRAVAGLPLATVRSIPAAGSYTAPSSIDHIERTVSYLRVAGYPFYIFVGQSTQQYLAPWKKEVVIAVSLLLSLMAFTVGAAWTIEKRTREMVALRAAERRSEELGEMNRKLVQEVRQREEAQSALSQAQVLLSGIIDSTSDLIWSVDPESFGIRAYNKRLQEYFAQLGIRIQVGMRPEELFSRPEYIQQWCDLYRRTLEQGSVRIEYATYHGGLVLDLNLNLLQEGERVFGISVFGKDITRRQQDFHKLQELSQRLHLAVTSANMGIWDWNVKDNKMFWDERMVELYGTTPGTSSEGLQVWLERLHPDDKDATVAACQAALRGEALFDASFRILRADGELRHIKANGLVILSAGGGADRMLGINQDITASKKAEEESLTLKAQLHQSQKMESIGRLAGGVAHDFNNMLSVIIGNAELAKLQLSESHPLWSHVEQISRAGQRSSQVTRQLLAFSRKQVINPEPVNLNSLIEESEKNLGRLIGEDVKLILRCSDAPGIVLIDASQVDQILMNLWINARDAMPDGGTLTVETHNVCIGEQGNPHQLQAPAGEYVQLVVSDTGCGMDRDTLEHIFEPFFTTKGVGKGTGLGLSTVYGIVVQNGGFINCYSEPRRGTVFRVYLPRVYPEALPEKPASQPPPSGTERILLVEDEEMLRWTASRMLEELGYQVEQAATPQQAIQLCQEEYAFDMILTDVVMPEMNGREMMERIRDFRPAVRVLFMSGYTAETVMERGILGEQLHFIEKPLDIRQLGEKIRLVLS